MPTVPRYERQVQAQAALTPTISLNTNATMFGAPTTKDPGKMVQGMAEDLNRHLMARQERMDAAAVMDADMALAERTRRMLYDPDNGYLNRKGMDALGSSDKAAQEIDAYAAEIEAGLKGERQKTAFRKAYYGRFNSSMTALARHEAGQKDVYVKTTEAAYIGNAISDAADGWSDPAIREQARGNILTVIERNSAGLSPEAQEALKRQHLTGLHQAVAMRMADVAPQDAMAYLEAHKDEIDGQTETKLRAALSKVDVTKRAQLAADEIVGAHSNITEALEAARSVDDPQLRDQLVTRVKTRFAEREHEARAQERAMVEGVWKHVMQGGALEQVPADVIAALPADKMRAILSYQERKAKGGGKIETDWQAYYGLMREAAENPKAFAKRDLNDFRGVLGDGEFSKLVTAQKGVLGQGQPKDKTAALSSAEARRIADRQLQALGFQTGTSKKAQKDAAKIAPFYEQYEAYLDAFETQFGRMPNSEEALKMVDALTIPGTISKPKTFFGYEVGTSETEAFAFQRRDLGAGEAFAVDDYDRIPTKMRAKIERALEQAKLPITEDAVLNAYKGYLSESGMLR